MKQTVIIYGNCHAELISYALRANKAFNKKYRIIPIKAIQNIYKKADELGNIPFEKCDVFIHQSIQLGNRYGEEYASEYIIKRLKENCTIISIPNVYHLPIYMFPQYYEEQEFTHKGSTIFFRDRLLDEAYENKLTVQEAINIYNNPETYSKEHIQLLLNEFTEKILKREKDWDIKLSEFIAMNNGEVLFYDPNHPTTVFFEYVINELVKLLGLENAGVKIPYRLDKYQMPITESVVRFFDCSTSNSIRKSGKKLCYKRMKLEEYVKQYWACEYQIQNNKSQTKSDNMYRKYSRRNILYLPAYLVNVILPRFILMLKIMYYEKIMK